MCFQVRLLAVAALPLQHNLFTIIAPRDNILQSWPPVLRGTGGPPPPPPPVEGEYLTRGELGAPPPVERLQISYATRRALQHEGLAADQIRSDDTKRAGGKKVNYEESDLKTCGAEVPYREPQTTTTTATTIPTTATTTADEKAERRRRGSSSGSGRGLGGLMGVVGVGLGVLLYLLRPSTPSTSQHTLLLPCNPRHGRCKDNEANAIIEMLVMNKTRTLIGSWPAEHCDVIESAALVTAATVIAWDCPKNPWMKKSSRVVRVLPELSTVASAVVNIFKHFRFKSIVTVVQTTSYWSQLFILLENSALKANISLKEAIHLSDGNYTVQELTSRLAPMAKSRARALVILAPLSWPQLPTVLQAFDSFELPTSCVFLLHLALHPGLIAFDDFLTKSAASVLVLTSTSSLQGEELEAMVNGSLGLARSGVVPGALSVEELTLWDWVGPNSNSSSTGDNQTGNGQWRPVLSQPIFMGQLLPIEPLISRSQDWLQLKSFYHNLSELPCDDDECLLEHQGVYSSIITLSILMAVSLILVTTFLFVASVLRRVYSQSRVSKGPCKVILTPTDFVFPQVPEVKRVEEGIEAMLCCWLQQLQELGGPEVDKPDLIKGSVGSLRSNVKKSPSIGSLSKISSDPRARYNGDLVQLKLLPENGSNFELKNKSVEYLVMLHGLRHENLNPMIGCLSEPGRPCLVWEFCSRGSLEDVLMADEIKLDWSFRLSLLTDLVRGMKYLHSSPAKVHGNLTSRNCVIDARWVLKITDYALPAFYENQNLAQPQKKAKELLWTAPEILRDPSLRATGTQAGDVYSFGIVMQEVVVRGEPYCMLSLPPEEILEKIRRPPPMIRPSVSKGAAPPEAINIMRQCWAEHPDKRPDFNTIHDLFKTLNHGRKANFVDTMFQMLEKYSNNLEDLIRDRTEQLDMEKKKTEQLLNRMLPSSVAEKLKVGMPVDPEEFSEVTIYFSDIVGFTTISAYSTPFEVVDLLNDLYTCFDATINAYNVYKVETIGDAYMVVGGLPLRVPDHAQQVATMALDLLHHSGKFRIRHLPFTPLRLRIGLHTGPCCAGVVGLTMPRYCLFGDTVNTASRMESTGSPWRIHMSETTKAKLEETGGYHIEARGHTELKGKGRVMTYWLLGKAGFDKQLPTPPPIRDNHGLDEQLVIYGRTGIMPTQITTEDYSDEAAEELTPAPIIPKKQKRPVYQLSLDAGLLATAEVESKSDGLQKWKVHRQMTFDSSTDDQKTAAEGGKRSSINPSEAGTNPSSSTLSVQGARRGSGFSASEMNVNSPAVSFINQSRSTQNLNGSSKYKRIVDENDLSSQYNHYRCLSPNDGNTLVPMPIQRAASSRFLRRQFSVDKEDTSGGQSSQGAEGSSKPTPRLFKQNSAGAANDLGRIDEIPPVVATVSQPTSSPKFVHSAYKHRTVQSTASSESLN
ncbi:Guanylate cyclase [Nesidiocoris tenuis]|uniref:Guanylate cyclase n=1 Tax=Nesidiocoris tenuis TaxID=355587 RepID=A0ABN7AY78_9HEMI|nr:Guanylate cyclase [Nesidiocoris tenuis]